MGNTREDYTLESYEKDFATTTTGNEDRKVEVENLPPQPPPPPPPPPTPSVFEDFYVNIPDATNQHREPFSSPPQPQQLHPLPNPVPIPPSSSTPPAGTTTRIVPPIIYIAGPSPAHVA